MDFRQYRGKMLDTGEWITGDVVRGLEQTYISTEPVWLMPHGEWFCTFYAVDPATIGQFTGLHDKNGKEIFEGDIIQIPDDWDAYGLMAGEVREVYFLAGAFRLKPLDVKNGRGHYLDDDASKFEIIGNIHDNPPL